MATGGVSPETQMSIEASSMFPGFRFTPTDVELISYYLKKKIEGAERCVEVISEIEICKHEPWDLPATNIAAFAMPLISADYFKPAKSVMPSESEWFFFSARGRKYPNGSQSKRATEHGYWKATGKERNVKSGSEVIGTKRTLVFHAGRAPKGERTEWIMHEYCMQGQSQDSLVVCRLRKNAEFRPSDTSNRGSVNETHLSTTHSSGDAVSDGGIGQGGVPSREKAAECSKSYDSCSIEQLSSASESEQKLSNDAALAESSSHQKDSDDDEDCFADILKHDIIKLDEVLLSSPPGLRSQVASNPEAKTRSEQPGEIFISEAPPLPSIPSQGTSKQPVKIFMSASLPLHSTPSQGTEHQPVEMFISEALPLHSTPSRGTEHRPVEMFMSEALPLHSTPSRGTEHPPVNILMSAALTLHSTPSRGTEYQPVEMFMSEALPLHSTPSQGTEYQPVEMFMSETLPLHSTPSQGTEHQPVEVIMSEALPLPSTPSQGTASRRIMLWRQMPGMSQAEMHTNNVDRESKLPVHCAKKGKLQHISAVFILLALLVSLIAGFKQVERIIYASMYRTSWH
uniref:NAC domain-containing protein n=1 Tax=Salix viminalis TaxID=40686 RepID=A0A6N2L4Z1_SALVM